MPVSISIEDNPEPVDLAAIQQGLADYNSLFSEADNHQLLTILLRESNNQLAGGLLGGTYWRWLHIDILFAELADLPPNHTKYFLRKDFS